MTGADLRRDRGRYPAYTRERLAQLSARIRRAAHPDRSPVDGIRVAGPTGRIPPGEAAGLDFQPAAIGRELGPLWATYWFEIEATAPDAWAGQPIDLYWDTRSEGLLRIGGRTVQGLNVGRHTARLTDCARPGETFRLAIETACNRSFGAAEDPERQPHPKDRFHLAACELRRFDPEAFALHHDFETLCRLEADREPPQTPRSTGGVGRVVRPALDPTWSGKLLNDLNAVANALDLDDRTTWPAARAALADLLAVRNGGLVHELSAIGHAHIDTAWLWPVAETWRKVQRSWSNALDLMDRYPDFRFAASQACQYAEIERRDPDLFARILAAAARGQWIPLGGSWVEPDCNLPSGESLSRQFLYGQRYFERAFGRRSDLFWNPDVFGYAGQLPQILRQAGVTRFLTQKLSWNRFTAPPHHTFTWRGLDGSEVLTHFPPADTYTAEATIEELRYHAANYKDADRSREGLFLYGFGDGGGGPDADMVERLARCRDLLGLPRVTHRDPHAVFDRIAADADGLGVQEGELYFEYHRGTYTSQAETKRLNRLCEGRLQTLDLLCAASRLAGLPEPSRAEVEALWRTLLLNQFHDILPGSSIGEVHATTNAELTRLADDAAAASDRLLGALARAGAPVPYNPIGVPRAEIADGPDGQPAWVEAPAFGAGRIGEAPDRAQASVGPDREIRLENAILSARLAPDGRLLSLVLKAEGREALSGPGNRVLLFDDQPTEYEAWDIDPFALETAREAAPADSVRVTASGPLRAEVRFERPLGRASRMVQTVRLAAGARRLEFHTEIDWRDRRTLVKVAFPTAARAPRAAYETLYGAVERPTHANTDHDLAQFEVPGHRWADLSEPGFGLSLLSDARYGYSVFGDVMTLSLVRGPKSPDPTADIGVHRFAYALYPHAGDWRAAGTMAEALRFCRPPLWAPGPLAGPAAGPLVTARPASVIIDQVKPAEDGADVIVRLYESGGGRCAAQIAFGFPVEAVFRSDTLEAEGPALDPAEGQIDLALRGFEIVTLRVRPNVAGTHA